MWHQQSFCEIHYYLICVGNITQITLDCMINRWWQRMFGLQSGQCMCVFQWLWDSVPWVEIMCGWVCVCACVGVSPWFINVGFSTTWAHSISSTHCNATGTHTCCPAQGQLGEAVDETDLKQFLWLYLALKQTQCALIDWLHSHMVFHASQDFKTIKSPAIYALICFDLSGGKGVSC